jgi:hsp70-interacting protein
MNNMLKWGIENSEVSRTGKPSDAPKTPLDPSALAALMSMAPKSDADLMKDRMAIIDDENADLEARLGAFDDFEQLIENLDNANNLEPLQLWTRLVKHLENTEADLRRYAAWCIGTAVENNARSQERVSYTT